MRITQVLSVPARTGFFTDDQAAIRIGVQADGFTYAGAPVTPGFTAVRQAGQAVSVMFVLDDGFVAQGDCAAVQYSGVGGRDVLFRAQDGQRMIAEHAAPALTGRELTTFRDMAPLFGRTAGAHRGPVRYHAGAARGGCPPAPGHHG